MTSIQTNSLNPAQLSAVEHENGALLVLAGAGSGKTRVITHRIARLIERGTAPHRILAVTFTNKAATEMRDRVCKMVGGDLKGLRLATFHGTCAHILRVSADRVGLTRDYTIYDANDQKRLMKEVIKNLGVENEASPREFLDLIDTKRNRHEGPESLSNSDPFDRTARIVWETYTKRLRKANAVDFGDLLTLALKVIEEDLDRTTGWAVRWDHVLVDEFQDTNRVQYLLTEKLSRHTGNLCVVGDDDQSIYSWRGADVSNILDFEKDFKNARVVKLEQNYRSTKNILDTAFSIIRNNHGRKPKRLWTDRGSGDPISVYVSHDERDEARYVAKTARSLQQRNACGDLAVFYRVHAQSRAIEEALREASIPYRMVAAVKFYDRKEIKDLLSYLRFLLNPASDLDLVRIINSPKRGIGAATLKKIADHAAVSNLSLYDAFKEAVRPDKKILGTGARKKSFAFISLMESLREKADMLYPSNLAEEVLQRTRYTEELSAAKNPEDTGRIENLLELIGSIRSYENEVEEPSLAEFLERTALTSDADGQGGAGKAVTLMTVHAAKGLEFPEVVVTGMEEGVFPHARGLYDENELEEERRLAYVACTRAKRRLHLTRAECRNLMGQIRYNAPARFLNEIPEDLLRYENRGGKRGARKGEDIRLSSGYSNFTLARSRPGGWNEIAGAMKKEAFRTGTAGSKSPKRGVSGSDVQWYSGMKVRHKKFGLGTVQAWYGSPPNQQISVYFFNYGIKTILSGFLTVA